MRPVLVCGPMTFALASCALLAAAHTGIAQQPPEALRLLVENRGAIRTAVVDLSRTDYLLAEKRGQEAHEMFQTVRFAQDRSVITYRGDEEGVVMRTPEGRPHPLFKGITRSRFDAPGEHWERNDRPLDSARVFQQEPERREDFRTLGVAAYRASVDIHDVVFRPYAKDPAPVRYEESVEGELRVVRVIRDDSTTTYWLDPSRSFAPVKVRQESSGGFWVESRSTLKLMDGAWFPEAVHSFHSQYRNGKEPAYVVRVHSATFNRPEHPQQLSPTDMGVEVGTAIDLRKLDGTRERGRWDGKQVISEREYVERAARGELKEGPNRIRAVAERVTGATEDERRKTGESIVPAEDVGPTVGLSVAKLGVAIRKDGKNLDSLWAAYVERFIAKYDLNKDQASKARSILATCQQQAHALLRSRTSEIERLTRRAAKARKLSGKDRRTASAAIEKERRTLVEPLDRIFEQRLKPRLEKLPTRVQRKAVESREAQGRQQRSNAVTPARP